MPLTKRQRQQLTTESRRVHSHVDYNLPVCFVCGEQNGIEYGERAILNSCGHYLHCSCLNKYNFRDYCKCGQPLTICGRGSSGGKRTRIRKSKSRRTKSKTRRRKSRK